MKIKLFDKELTFSNEQLYNCVIIAIKKGYKVHTFNPSGFVISQVFIDNGITFGSISANFSGIQHSTCHKAANGIGTGFGFGSIEVSKASQQIVDATLMFCPSWVSYSDRDKIIKQSWTEYQNQPIAKILKYSEIKL